MAMAHQQQEPVPDMVRTFVMYFYRHIREKNGAAASRCVVYEILSMYETSFAVITDKYFKASAWPPVEAVAPFVGFDAVFLLLYRELYYRHIFARMTPTLEQRCSSWANYCELFAARSTPRADVLLLSLTPLQVVLGGNVNMQLPNLWLWEMIDEFIYQFQSFAQYRGKLGMKSPEEVEALRSCTQVWDVLSVLQCLQSLADTSAVGSLLEAERRGEGSVMSLQEGYDPGSSNVLRVLGYYSLIGLARVHALLGDHAGCLRALDPVELDKPGLFTRVPGAHVTTLYYVGFAYLSSRRHTDAIRTFNAALVYIARHKRQHERAPGYEQIQKKADQMFALLAVAVSLCPQTKLLDDGVRGALAGGYTDKMQKMASGDESVYDELWSYACPKFVTSAPPDWADAGSSYSQEAYRQQLRLFLFEVRAAAPLPGLRAALRLYTTIPVAKLGALLEMDEGRTRALLLAAKRQSTLLEWRQGPALTGVWVTTGDVDWRVDGDVVHCVDCAQPGNVVAFLASAIEHQRLLQASLITPQLAALAAPV